MPQVKGYGEIDRRLLTARAAVDDEVLKPKLFKARRVPEGAFGNHGNQSKL